MGHYSKEHTFLTFKTTLKSAIYAHSVVKAVPLVRRYGSVRSTKMF